MKYIWINPVVADMYQPGDLRHFLKSHGFIQVEVSLDWLEIVRKKYRTLLENTKHTVIDMRCPKAIDFIDAYELRHKVEVPSIEPILLHVQEKSAKKKSCKVQKKSSPLPAKH